MTKKILLSTLAVLIYTGVPAEAETGQRCDADQDRLTGTLFTIAPDGRFCEMSESELAALDAQAAAAEEAAKAAREAQYARYKAALRARAIQNGYTPAQADAAIAKADADARKAVRHANNSLEAARIVAGRSPTPRGFVSPASGGCLNKSGSNLPCIPTPNIGGAGAAISRSFGF